MLHGFLSLIIYNRQIFNMQSNISVEWAGCRLDGQVLISCCQADYFYLYQHIQNVLWTFLKGHMQKVCGADSFPSPAIKVKDVSSLLFLYLYSIIFMSGMSVPVPILYDAEQVYHG